MLRSADYNMPTSEKDATMGISLFPKRHKTLIITRSPSNLIWPPHFLFRRGSLSSSYVFFDPISRLITFGFPKISRSPALFLMSPVLFLTSPALFLMSPVFFWMSPTLFRLNSVKCARLIFLFCGDSIALLLPPAISECLRFAETLRMASSDIAPLVTGSPYFFLRVAILGSEVSCELSLLWPTGSSCPSRVSLLLRELLGAACTPLRLLCRAVFAD
jgi:hypothetical protein